MFKNINRYLEPVKHSEKKKKACPAQRYIKTFNNTASVAGLKTNNILEEITSSVMYKRRLRGCVRACKHAHEG